MTQPRNKILENLANSECEIIFQKKDGTPRVMKCTLNSQLVPNGVKSDVYKSLLRSLKEENNVIPVWDMQKNSWRSFRSNSVEEIRTVGVFSEQTKAVTSNNEDVEEDD